MDYADGRILSGTEAYRLGFVDELGTFDDSVKRARSIAGIHNANLVQYQQRYDLSDFFKMFGQTDSKMVKVDLGLDVFKLAYFLSPISSALSVKSVTIITHPLVQHNLTRLRDKRTGPEEFRRVLSEVASLMVYEATRSFGVTSEKVNTPLARTRGFRLQREVVLVPVLRAGLGMLDSILQLIPHAKVGFIGLKAGRNHARATRITKSLPPDSDVSEVILIDPMLATGGSGVAAMDLLTEFKNACAWSTSLPLPKASGICTPTTRNCPSSPPPWITA